MELLSRQNLSRAALVCLSNLKHGMTMPRVVFTQNIQRHVACPDAEVAGTTVGEVLAAYFEANPKARRYVLDDQSALRKHMIIFIDGEVIADRVRLGDPVSETTTIYVFQSLSGG